MANLIYTIGITIFWGLMAFVVIVLVGCVGLFLSYPILRPFGVYDYEEGIMEIGVTFWIILGIIIFIWAAIVRGVGKKEQQNDR